MFVFLSSDSNVRYADDVRRCMAMPIGATLAFRYDIKYMSDEARKRLFASGSECSLALLAFVSHSGELCPVVPLRFAEILHVVKTGSSLWIALLLGDLAVCTQPELFAPRLDVPSEGTSPRIVDGKVVGKHALYVPAGKEGDLGIGRSNSLSDWEATCEALSKFNVFAADRVFGVITAIADPIREADLTNALASIPAEWKPNQIVEIRMYCRDFGGSAQPTNIVVQAHAGLALLSSEKQTLDSRYDLKMWRLQSKATLLRREPALFQVSFGNVVFDIEGWVAGNAGSLLVRSALAGIFFTAPAFATYSQGEKTSVGGYLLVGLAAFVAGTVFHLVTVFGVRPVKP